MNDGPVVSRGWNSTGGAALSARLYSPETGQPQRDRTTPKLGGRRAVAPLFITEGGEAGSIDVVHELEEITDLHDLVERGPHCDTVERTSSVRVNRSAQPSQTRRRRQNS